MADCDFNYRACCCQAVRTFRLRRPLPLLVEFFAIRYTIDLYEVPHTAGGTYLIARLPWQDFNYARQLMHAGIGLANCRRIFQFDVDCGTLQEVLFLRLVR